jgi:8-oxo-dGTP pyrophosphatase MutT (NUDIX family)
MDWKGFSMLLRDCAGGVIFYNDTVFLIQNEKNEWVMPKGLIKEGESPEDAAIRRVFEETAINGRIVEQAGRTYYEFYSITRQKPVCNRIAWYIMQTDSDYFRISEPERFSEGGFFDIPTALDMITYSQDKSLVMQSYKKLCDKLGKKTSYE